MSDNHLLDVARRNIRQFIAKAAFASEVDRLAASQCIDVMEAALSAHGLPVADQIRQHVFNALDALDGGLDRGTVQDNLVQELLRIASAQPAEAVGGKATYCFGCEYEAATEAEAAAGECPRCGAGRVADASQGVVAQWMLVEQDLAFADWLVSEIPPGTVVSNPQWWAPRIARAYRRTHPTPDTTAAELLGLVDRLERMQNAPHWQRSGRLHEVLTEMRTLAGKIKESGDG